MTFVGHHPKEVSAGFLEGLGRLEDFKNSTIPLEERK